MFALTAILVALLSVAGVLVRADFVGNETVSGNVPIITTAGPYFDGPMVSGINATSFDWWYFDAVSQNGEQEITITFWRSAFASPFPEPNFVSVNVVWSNGTIGLYYFPAAFSSVTTVGYGANGVWSGVGSFNGTSSLSSYTVALNAGGIKGYLTIQSIAPAHYADGLPPGNSKASPVAFPGIYWANAIPAGVAEGTFIIFGESFQLKNAVGYHDHNWGPLGFPNDVSWYWGHATVGEFSYVYAQATESNVPAGTTYLVQNGEVLVGSLFTPFAASEDFGLALPFGNGTQFPATSTSNLPSNFLINIVDSKNRLWSFVESNVHFAENVYGPLTYTRWIGTVCGGQVGGQQACGSGVWEWFRFNF